MRIHPRVIKLESDIKEFTSEGLRLEEYITKYILDKYTKLECLNLNVIVSIEEIKINDKVFNIPNDFKISNREYCNYRYTKYLLNNIKNKEQYSVSIDNINWSLLPSYARQLVMCEDKSWTVSSGGMRPLKGRWVTYSAYNTFDFMDSLDVPFYIEAVDDWQNSYTQYNEVERLGTHFVNSI